MVVMLRHSRDRDERRIKSVHLWVREAFGVVGLINVGTGAAKRLPTHDRLVDTPNSALHRSCAFNGTVATGSHRTDGPGVGSKRWSASTSPSWDLVRATSSCQRIKKWP